MGLLDDFDIRKYEDIHPSIHEYREGNDAKGLLPDRVHNLSEADLDKCVWGFDEPEIMTPHHKRIEIQRCMDTGYWFILKGKPVWVPPNYYMFLRFFRTGGVRPNFRLNRLLDVYEKIRTRKNPFAIGDFTIKARQIGETTMEMSNCLYEAAKMDYGLIGIQSMTRQVVKQSCWRTLIMGWNGIDRWLKDEIFSEFSSGDFVAESMKFSKEADDNGNGKDVQIMYTAGTFDSVNNMRRVIFDEWLKWEEQSPYGTFLNYEKFVVNGTTRKGLFSIFSSPPDRHTKYADECYKFWQNSDPNDLNENGTTKTGVFRHYTSPLTGIEGFYDKWGDADPNPIYKWIMDKRKSVPQEYRLAEIRAYPLDESEMFGSVEGSHTWPNSKGITDRKIYLLGTRFKDEKTKEPTVVYGNLERVDGYIDGEVEFRMSDLNHFDLKEARFCFSYLPQNRQPLKSVFHPPAYIENCLGVDPFNNRYPAKHVGKQSNGAMVNRVFRNLFDKEYDKCPTMIYCCRPTHQEIFFEDVLKAAIFNRSMIQYENRSDKLANYAEDRGYFDWLLPEIGESINSTRKGDAPSGGKNQFLDTGMGLISANTNTPLHDGDPYYLEYHWFVELLEDYLKFNPLDTHENDLVMADIQSLLGCVKILHKKIRQPSEINTGVLDYLLT